MTDRDKDEISLILVTIVLFVLFILNLSRGVF